jgi:hypothetical protein
VELNDRRPARPSPSDEDFERPLSKTGLAEANRSFVQAGVRGRLGTDPDRARGIVRKLTKDRFTARRRGQDDFGSIGSYVAYLQGEADGLQ